MNNYTSNWLLLITSLPSNSATPRMRLWRAIKTLGCVPLRDGAYLLPNVAAHADALAELAEQTNKDGGQAWVVHVKSRSAEDDGAFTALFDRSTDYTELTEKIKHATRAIGTQSIPDIAKSVARMRKELEALQQTDFFPGDATVAAESAWWELNDTANALLSPDEPRRIEQSIPALIVGEFQARQWATRKNLWVDRVASAWLIQRFIDRKPAFIWLDSPAHCPKDAIGFDFDGATFTHVNDKVTFEVLMTSFGLDDDRGLIGLASLVHTLDVGGTSNLEAAGFEAILSGIKSRLNNDDALLTETGAVLDSLYSHYKKEHTK